MGYPITQSQAAQPLVFLMIDSADHIAPKTGLSPTVVLSKNGGAFAAPAGSIGEIGNGWYKVAGHAADSDTLGPLLLHATAAGADPTDDRFDVVAYDPRSATNLGLSCLPASGTLAVNPILNPKQNFDNTGQTTSLPANARDWLGSPIAPPNLPGVPVVDITQVGGEQAQTTNDPITANVIQWNGVAIAPPDSAGYPKVTIKSGTGPGEIDLTDGNLAGSVARVVAPVAVGDKAGYSLAPSGLDSIAVTDPGAPSNHTTLPRMLVALWRRGFKKSSLGSGLYKFYGDDGVTVNSMQDVSDDGTIQVMGEAR